ncbi:nucleoprotein TPR [Lepeophtheirus salmonis]|uniref:nucleoprotein TPR n=1 Tax=Lepeophtheirus salmonis TaxID=72036 RepID=UPI001AE6B335|nr:nucleoprotein TPR-like [Lepeophtheirus salmonis]
MYEEEDESNSESLIRAFGKDLLDKLDPWICSELSQKWSTFYEETRERQTQAEKERLAFQQSRFELEADLNSVREKYEAKIAEHEADSKELCQLRVSHSEARRKLGELEEANTNLNIDIGSLRRERDGASSERSDLADLAERRQKEIDRLNAEWKSLSEQLIAANNAKCEALVRAEEVESKEVSLKYKEERMEEERTYLNKTITDLKLEIEASHEEFITFKREQVYQLADIQAELSSKYEDARHFEAKEKAYKEDIEMHSKRAEELAKLLKKARDSEIHFKDNFEQELNAQTKLAQIYKDHSEEEKQKHDELEDAVKELQSLLKKSSEKYGELEAKLDKMKSDNNIELKKRNEAIKALKLELENANSLIKNFNTKGLSAEGIENLSPSAAAASRLMKPGMTLTQIYAQLVAVNEELICEKDETQRLNTYLDQILAEIEERAPILKQQRDDYERAVSSVSRLTERIEEAQEEVDLRKREAEDATRRLGGVKRENERLSQQVKDLSQQIVTLVSEVEALRSSGGSFMSGNRSLPVEAVDADSVITSNLVSFRNIEDLQAKNAELLSVVRELSEKVETVETHLVEEKTSELRKELVEALKQVEELKEARVRQEAMVDNIISQRDLYKSVADQKEEQRKPDKWASPEVEKKLAKTEVILQEITKEFNVYRTEKCENEKLLLVQLEKVNKDLSESRAKTAKLSSQEEYNTERFKILQNNSKSFQTQINLLEERNKKLSEIVAKHESSLSSIRNMLLEAQSALSKSELKLERLKYENDSLKAAEARYGQEREVFYRERKSSAIVTQNLKQIQLHLERDEDEAKMRLQNQNDGLSKEISLIQKKLVANSEAFRESVSAWENTQKELRTKLDEAASKETQANDEIKTLKNDIEEVRKELKEANEKLELAGRSSSTPTPIQHPPTSGKIRDLELLLNQSKNEVKSLKDQLINARQAVNQFKDLANSAEKRLTESSAATKVFREDYERRLKEAEESKKTIESQLEKIKAEKVQESARRQGVDRSENDIKEEINVLQTKLDELTCKYSEAVRIKEEAQKSLEEQSAIASETQAKYERELVEHAQNVQLLQKYKEDLVSREDRSNELLYAKEQAEEKLKEITCDKEANEKLLRMESNSLKEQLDVLEQENKAVHERLLNVTTQMTSLRQSSKDGDSKNQSFSEEEAGNSTQLMQIIKYLRKEKEIITSKYEIVQAELARNKSEKEYIQGLLEESTSALNLERENSSSTVMSASKHFELIQKVETLSALMDSNRLLREEKTGLSEEVGNLKVKLNDSFESCNPLKKKISVLEGKEESLTSENITLRGEATRWRQRATQLIEKSNKVNPEELKKIQTENNSLKKQLTQVQTQVRQNTIQVNSLTIKLRNTEEKASNDIKLKLAEISKLMQEKNSLNLKNIGLLKRVTELENNLKSAKTDVEKLKSSSIELSMKQSLEASINSYKEEIDKLKEEATKRDKTIKEQMTSKNTSISKLRTIGRQFKDKLEATEKELTKLKSDSANFENEISNLKKQISSYQSAEASISTQTSSAEVDNLKERLRQADELVQESATKIAELEEQLNDFKRGNSTFKKVEELEKEIEEIREASLQKEQRARAVLKTARQKIIRINQTNSTLSKEIHDLKTRAPTSTIEENQVIKENYENQIETLTVEKVKLQDRIKKMMETMSKKLQESNVGNASVGAGTSQPSSSSSSSAPVMSPASAPDVQTLSVKPMQSSVQPQAHIQPTRQKVSVQPMRMSQQRGASTSVVRASSSLELPQVSVQPTIVSVSPSSSSSTNITNLNPSASEFVPRPNVGLLDQSHNMEHTDDGSTPTAMVVPCGHSSVPSDDNPQPGPSTSSSTASVPPTPKRSRDDNLNEDPNKKPKLSIPVSMTEVELQTDDHEDSIVVLDNEEVGEEEVQENVEDEIMVYTEEEAIRDEEDEEVIQEEEETEDEPPQEEEEDDEDDEEQEEEEDEGDEEVLEEDDENTRVSLETEPIDVDDDEDVVEVSDTESNTQEDVDIRPTSHQGSSLKIDLEDCVVPSTPRLGATRNRNEGFSEVVTSPNATSRESQFVFSAPTDTEESVERNQARIESANDSDGGGSIVPEGVQSDEPEPQHNFLSQKFKILRVVLLFQSQLLFLLFKRLIGHELAVLQLFGIPLLFLQTLLIVQGLRVELEQEGPEVVVEDLLKNLT